MKKPIIVLLLLLMCVPVLFAQKGSKSAEKQELFEEAQEFIAEEDYVNALYDYLKIYDLNPNNCNICFHIGQCYINIPGEETKAIPYLEKAVGKISTNYDDKSIDETRAPLHALFYLGIAYRVDNQLGRALEMYSKFRNHKNFESLYNETIVDNEIKACERAKLIQDNPVKIKIKNLGPVINNANANFRPVVNSDETLIIYMTSLKFYDAIMMSRKVNGEWTEPDNISSQVGSDGDCEPCCLSADGTELYLVKKTKNNFDIYVSTLKDNLWSNMVPLNKNINSSKNETHACISKDGKTLYFASDRRGGIGKLDLYKSTREIGGDWGPAVNLGKTINTIYNENMPFITEDGKTLYFSSEGLLNMGGYDIFSSRITANKEWEKPINAGYPINTTSNDFYYFPLKNGKIAYYAKNLPGGFGKEDIYRIENLTVEAMDSLGFQHPMRTINIVIRDKKTKDTIGVVSLDQSNDSLKVRNYNDKIEIHIDE